MGFLIAGSESTQQLGFIRRFLPSWYFFGGGYPSILFLPKKQDFAVREQQGSCFLFLIHTLVLNLTGVRGPKKKASHWVCACVWGSSGSGLTVQTSDSQHGDRGSSLVRGTFFLFTFFVPLTLCCELNVYNRWFCTCVTRSRSSLTVKTSDSQHEDRGSSPVLGTFFLFTFFVPKRLRGTKNVNRRTSAPTGI